MKLYPLILLLVVLNQFPLQAAGYNGNGTSTAPEGLVLVIIDGLGASYIYPEYQPRALDGSFLEKPSVRHLSQICNESIRIQDVSTSSFAGNSGHNILVSGTRDADDKMVAYPGVTIYDVLESHGYLSIAVMEKGDSAEICAEQTIILHDTTNSINDPAMAVEQFRESDLTIVGDLRQVLEECADASRELINGTKEGGIERYHAYNRLVFEAAEDVIRTMAPSDTPYILTLNAGAVDSAGHYRGYGGYADTIEAIDPMIYSLYELCRDNNLALVITSDHGMAFPDPEKRGGVQSGDYSLTPEVRRIPLIICSPNAESGIIGRPADQQDIAPTILSLLDIPEDTHFCTGTRLPVKNYATLKVACKDNSSLCLLENKTLVSRTEPAFEHAFNHLAPGTDYTLVIFGDNDSREEIRFSLSGDRVLDLTAAEGGKPGLPVSAGYFLIGVINLSGIVMIFRIIRQDK
jgi:bisphosphoglycerate-independent phosphoglycerate mutase (AlkP superfamily)